MSNAKILLPISDATLDNSSGRKNRTSVSNERRRARVYQRGNNSCGAALETDTQQRNEAIGLLMVGGSAFSMSLLHYATASQSYPFIQSSMVHIGMGVYILPSLIGILGVQKFMNKPLENLWWRIGGCLGTTVAVLGLLGTEGGKLGAHTFTVLSNIFGNIPTYLLLATGLTASMIFALDILYKDLLATSLIMASLITRCIIFLWELLVSFITMTIGAVKTTRDFFSAIFRRLWKLYTDYKQSEKPSLFSKIKSFLFKNGEKTNQPEIQKEINNNNIDVKNNEELENLNKTALPLSSTTSNIVEAEEATIVLNDSNNSNEIKSERVETSKPVIQNGFIQQITVANVSGITIADSNSISLAQFGLKETKKPSDEKNSVSASIKPKDDDESKITQEERINSVLSKIYGYSTKILNKKTETNKDVYNNTEVSHEANKIEKNQYSEEETCKDEDENKNENENENKDEDEIMIINAVNATKKPTESIYLDDNPIGREIKYMESEDSDISDKEEFIAKLPIPEEILKIPKPRNTNDIKIDLENRSRELLQTLSDFGIKATITDVVYGPAISRFELKPAPGVKVSRITSLSDDMALALSARSIRIEAPIPGKPAIGIEIPNKEPTPVYFYDLVHNDKFVNSPVLLNIALGQTINGQAVYADLADMPHLLIAGSTGSGKSVCVNTIIASILFRARSDQVKFIMIDPKMVELSSYNGIPHMIAPVVTDPQKAGDALLWAQEEMTRRYTLLAECGCKKLESYNERLEELRKEVNPNLEKLPMIVIVIDELADLMMTARDKVETTICRLAQMARAVGIHLIIATQRPSVDVLTGLIKANLPTRIAFSVTSAVDSKTILDGKGAEKLIGKGDMLFIPKGLNKPLRVQGAFVSDGELKKLVDFVKTQGEPEYVDIQPVKNDDDDDEEDDIHEDVQMDSDAELTSRIINYLETQEKTSTSMLQRKFRIGYNRAARIMDQLEERGMVTPTDGSNKRRVLIGRSISQL